MNINLFFSSYEQAASHRYNFALKNKKDRAIVNLDLQYLHFMFWYHVQYTTNKILKNIGMRFREANAQPFLA